MMSPGRIALTAASALGLAVFILMAIQQLVRYSPGGVPLIVAAETAALAGLILGGIVWVGTYIGARLSSPSQRTARLMKWLTLTYLVLAILLTLPIRTHAVKMDMPPPAAPDAATSLVVLNPLVMTLGIPLVVVAVFALITRGLAAVLGRRSARDKRT